MSLTSADAVIQISITSLFNTPFQLEQFSADDVFDTPAVKPNQVQMGVDGFLTGGKVLVEVPQSFTLQADSPSNDYIDEWYAQEQAAVRTFIANGLIVLPSLGKKWTMVRGFLTSYVPIPPAKKLLQPRSFEITWNKAIPAAA